MAINRETNCDPENPEFEAPPKLVLGLKELQNESVFVPRTVDEAILRAARQHLTKPDGRIRRWAILIPSFGAALLILVFVLLWQGNSRWSSQSRMAREDINHDGHVDILDAFALARELPAKASASSKMDLNGDGVVDGKDVELIAAEAVQLRKTGS